MIVIASENDIRVPIYDKNVEDIKDYMSYYKFFVKQLVQAKNVLEAMNHNQSNKHILKSLEKKIDTFQKESLEIIMKIKKIISQDQLLYQSFNNIKTIKGVGDISAIVLLHLFIKYPAANQRQIISLAGLEPTTKSSGSSVRTKPKISKAGSKLYRGTLFMSALTVIRFNPKITEFYNRLKDNGKQSTVAQVAVMRKSIIIVILYIKIIRNIFVLDEAYLIKFNCFLRWRLNSSYSFFDLLSASFSLNLFAILYVYF